MAWKQIKPFNQSKGGTKKGYCLQNVRLGYEIVPKYENATEAWSHAGQHNDRNVPLGIDVPLFYKYITGYGNEGHINVRLANGKVWSDGEIFASIEDYEAKKVPDFLGWGESVNGIRVIEYAPDPPKPQSTHRYQYLVGKRIQLKPKNGAWNAYKEGTDEKVGDLLKVPGADGQYVVRGVSVRANRILVNSAALGQNISVPLASSAGVEYSDEWKVI